MKPSLLLPGRLSPFLQNRQTPFIKQINYPKNISFFFKKKFKPEEKIEKSFKKQKTYSVRESWVKMLTKGTYENFLHRKKYTPSLKEGNENISHEAKIAPRIFCLTTNTCEPKPRVPSEPEIPPQLNLIPPKCVETRMMELNEQHKTGLKIKQNVDVSKYSSKPPYSEFVPPKRSESEVEKFYPNDSEQTEQLLLFATKDRHEDALKSSSGKRSYNSPTNITESDTQFKVDSLSNGQNIMNNFNLPLMESGRKNLQYFTMKINHFSKSSQPFTGLTQEKPEQKEITSVLSSPRNPKMKRSVQKNMKLKKVKKVDMKKRNIKKSLKLRTDVSNSLENIKSSKISSLHIKSNKKNITKLIKTISKKKMPRYASHTSFTGISFKHQDMNKSKDSSDWKVRKWLKNIDKQNKVEKMYIAQDKSRDKDNKINENSQNAERENKENLNNSYPKLSMRKNNQIFAGSEIRYDVNTLQHSSRFFNLKSHNPKKQIKLTAHEILAKYSLDRIAPTHLSLQMNLSDKNNNSNIVGKGKQDFVSIKGYKSIQASILDKIQQRMKPAEYKVTHSMESSGNADKEKLELMKNIVTRKGIQQDSNNAGKTNSEGEEKNSTGNIYIEKSGNFKDGFLNESYASVKKQGYLRKIFNLDSDSKEVNKLAFLMIDQKKSLRMKEDTNKQDITRSLEKESYLLESSPNSSEPNSTTGSDQINPLHNLVLIGHCERYDKEVYDNISTMIKDPISTDKLLKVMAKHRLKDKLNKCSSVVPVNFYRNINNPIRANDIIEGRNGLLADIYSALQSKSQSNKDFIIPGIFSTIYMNNVYRGLLNENLPYFHLPAHLYKYINLKPELLYMNCLKYFPQSITSKKWNENQMQDIFHRILQNRMLPDIPFRAIQPNKNETYQSIENEKQHDICLPVIHEGKKSSLSTCLPVHRITKRNFSTSYQNHRNKKSNDRKTHHINKQPPECKKKEIVPCKKIRLPGCRKANVKCTGVLEYIPCLRKEPPQPSFSECIKFSIRKEDFTECDCHKEKKRACLSNIKEPKHYDGCTKAPKKKVPKKKDEGEECD